MKPPQILAFGLACLLCAGLGAFFAMQFGAPRGEGSSASLVDLRDSVRRLEGEMAAMREERDSLSRELASLRAADAGSAPQRMPDVEDAVARAIEDWLAEHGAEALGAAGAPDAAADGALSAEERDRLVDTSIRRFLDPTLKSDEREELWEQIREAGLVHEVIAQLEAEVAASPDNVDLKVELGYAYLQPMFSGEATGPEAGEWAMKSDEMYDQALERDPQHWDARFSKAVSLSFWPPIFGKQAEAIRHFETLIDQQSRVAPEARHAQTFLFLGNLHQQAGRTEKAAEVWQQGLAQFPDDQELRQALGDG